MRQMSGAGGNNSRRSNRKQNLADDSLMTDQSDDERARLEFRGERGGSKRGVRGNSGRVVEKQRMTNGGNITNIINNNNINNFIINDPSKAPPVFHMA